MKMPTLDVEGCLVYEGLPQIAFKQAEANLFDMQRVLKVFGKNKGMDN